MADTTYGFADGSQYNAAGTQVVAPTAPATVNPDRNTGGIDYVPTFSGNTATGTSTTASSSDAYGNTVDNLGNTITDGTNKPPVINTGFGTVGYDPSTDPAVVAAEAADTKRKADEQTLLDAQRKTEIDQLTNDKTNETTKLGETQANETGTSNRNLAYLQQGGQSASAMAYLNQLQVSHTREMTAMTAKYDNSIAQAKNAYDQKDFALAEKYAKEAQGIKDDAYKRNQDFIDNTLKIQAEVRQEQTAQLEQQKAQQTFNKDNKVASMFYQYPGSSVVFSSKTGEPVTAAEYKALGGTGGDFKDIQVIDPHAADQHSPAYVEWQDYLNSGGKYMTFNDYQTMDTNRKARIAKAGAATTYNELKDTAKQQAAAAIGGTLAKLAGTDQYVSPEDYKKGLQKWTTAGYGADEYNKQFMNYLNPTDLARGNYGVTK